MTGILIAMSHKRVVVVVVVVIVTAVFVIFVVPGCPRRLS